MKKKKQKHNCPAADLKSTIHSQSEFFDYLIELIPVRFYVPDDADSKPWYQGLSKAAKASLRQKSKENLKLVRRHRFDPDVHPSSTAQLVQQRQNGEDDGDSQAKEIDAEDSEKKSVTYEELREKLRRKIEALRGNRGEKKTDERRARYEEHKRKKMEGVSEERETVDEDDDDGDDDGEEIIEYGKVRLGDEGEGKVSNKKRKLSKAKELEKAKKKQEVKKENPTVAERESWNAAVSRAMGVKVHDDARLIKGSMKREKRRKEKNAEKWNERVGTVEKMKEERQKKRRDNIAGRINDKKMRKIAKREKKLMRPGFEGRKEGFITKE